MKKRYFFLLSLLTTSMLLGCVAQKAKTADVGSNNYQHTVTPASLGEFDLVSPSNGMIVEEIPTFTWQECANADTYTVEICSNEGFISDVESVDYYSQKNVTTNSLTIHSNLRFKNETYYWRVTAYDQTRASKKSVSTFTFFYKASEVEEVKLDLGTADDWSLHSLGSRADISIDNSNFFNNNEKSLVISFKEEDTHKGNIESDGWIVVTKTVEKNLYGTDALFFNLYYAGQDSTIFIRLVDRDNEYWHCPIQISNNAKQSVIMKFSDFEQRTRDVTVANEVFDYERIKYMEIVFERTFGDGVFLMSGLKAIKFANYREYFIEHLDFSKYGEEAWTSEAYEYEREIDQYTLTLKHYGTNDEGKPKINGYGFAKLNVNRYLYSGDSIKVSIKYSGNKGTNVLLRIYEEDTDRWSYSLPYSTLSTDEFTDVVIPFAAFAQSSMLGDGKRQFYFILNIQFGLEGQYGTGTLTFKDFEIVSKADYIEDEYRPIGNDGLIENFDSYKTTSEIYFAWKTSSNNKDEYMSLNSTNKAGGATNPFCGQFEYKSDMEAAEYGIPVSVKDQFTAVSFWIKDASLKTSDPRFPHVTDWSPKVRVALYLLTGEIYTYYFEHIDKIWYAYTIPFSEFECSNTADLLGGKANPISGPGIGGVSISFQYFYYDNNGNPLPVYSYRNKVYVDTFKFTFDTDFSKVEQEKIIHMDGDKALIDDFEAYSTTDDLLVNWNNGRDYEYQLMALSNDVSSEGGNHSIDMQYRTNSDSISYYIAPGVASDVEGRGMRLSLKGDNNVTVYVNIYLTVGSTNLQYRATLTKVSSDWTEYCIGFSNFTRVDSTDTTRSLTTKDMPYVTRVSFGAVRSGDTQQTLSHFYADNIMFDSSLTYSTNTKRTIDQEGQL